jgi:hypothetical protein
MTPEEEAAAKKAADATSAGTTGTTDEAAKQAELNRQFAERAKRGEETATKKLWEAIGVSTQDEWDSFVKAKKETEDANKSALEKAADEATRAKARADKLEADSKTLLEAAQRRITDGEIKLIATQPVTDKDGKVTRAAFRADALDLVLLAVDRKEIKDEDGKVVGIEKALEALAKEKPFLLANQQNQSQTQSAAKGTPPPAKSAPQNQNQTAPPTRVVGSTL